MNLSKWRNRGLKGLTETANLVVLTILSVVSFLTGDWGLFGIGMVVEGIYLASASGLLCYRRRLELRAQSGKRGVEFLDQVLLLVTVAGFVVILFFGFGKHLLNHRWPYLTHAEGWEAGAIGWTGLFLVYYLIKFQATGNFVVDKFIILILGLFGLVLLWLAGKSMGKPLEHVPFVWAIGACFLIIDLLSMLFHREKKERLLSKASLLWADAPMVFAFGVLWLYLLMHRDTENPDVFVSGVISCQLLISNVVFVVMEFGLLKSPKETATGSAAQ
jgi:hypothetical protein